MVTHASIKISNGGHNLIDIEEFIIIPLGERMALLTSHSLTFLDENGEKVPLMDGIKFVNSLIKAKKS